MVVLLFYGLGGGKAPDQRASEGVERGLNMALPLPRLDTAKRMDKMAFYAKADRDSLKRMENRKRDPYARGMGVDSTRQTGFGLDRKENGVDQQAARVLERLGEMKRSLNSKEPMAAGGRLYAGHTELSEERPGSARFRGEALTKPDPEMAQLDGMLDKLMRLQHRDGIVKDSLVAAASTVRPVVAASTTVSLGGKGVLESAGFVEIGEAVAIDTASEETIPAVIGVDQVIESGMTIGFRLDKEVIVGGVVVPVGSMVYGVASLSGERLKVMISSIRVNRAIVPVALEVYDLDGLAGIRAPGALTRDVAKSAADESIGQLGMTSLDPSLGAQAAGAGLQFARVLTSRKVRQIRVAIEAGYRVLLRNVIR